VDLISFPNWITYLPMLDAEEQSFSQILHCAYMKKMGTHEKVAEYLHMSIPTYYRYLRKAVRRLSYELIKEEPL